MNEEPTCYLDGDGNMVTCGEGRACVTGECLSSPPYCSATKPCAPGQTCENDVCSCAADTDCGEAGKCGPEGRCFVSCRSNKDCTVGICAPNGRCVSRCMSNASCDEGQVCLITEGYCVPTPERAGDPEFSCSAQGFAGAGLSWVWLAAIFVFARRRRVQRARPTVSCGKKSTSGP